MAKKEKYVKWIYHPADNLYVGTRPFEVKDILEPGYYELSLHEYTGDPIATALKQKTDRLCSFNNGPVNTVMKEIETFWNGDQAYKDLGMTHKRSILLHGAPGCGKTGIVSSVIAAVVKRQGIAIKINNIRQFAGAIPYFREIQPDSPIVAVVEDIESQIERMETKWLEILDGASSIGGNVLYLSTTNNLASIPERIRCRPSRIDTLIKINHPDAKQRAEYVEFILQNVNIRFATKSYMAALVEASAEFSLADLKELVVSTYVYKKTIEEAVERIKSSKVIEKTDDEDSDDEDSDDESDDYDDEDDDQ